MRTKDIDHHNAWKEEEQLERKRQEREHREFLLRVEAEAVQELEKEREESLKRERLERNIQRITREREREECSFRP